MSLDVSTCSYPILAILLGSIQTSKRILNNPLFSQMASFIFAKLSTTSIVQGLLKGQLQSYVLQGFLVYSMMRKESLLSILKSKNLPWSTATFISYMILNQIKGSANVTKEIKEVPKLNNVVKTIDQKKTHQKEIITYVALCLSIILFIGVSYTQGVKNLLTLFKYSLNFKGEKKALDHFLTAEEIEMTYDVKEMEDYVLVEEKTHQEKVDKSGVVVIDW